MPDLDIRPSTVKAFYNQRTPHLLASQGGKSNELDQTRSQAIHYHIGPVDSEDLALLRNEFDTRSLIGKAGERLLITLAKHFEKDALFEGKTVLDVGCGLGGTCIFLAQNFGATVTGITIADSHIEVARNFVQTSGLSHKVTLECSDCHLYEPKQVFDTVVSIEATCHFNRPIWMNQLQLAVVPGSRLLIVDYFLNDPGDVITADLLNGPYNTNVGTERGYVESALSNNFRLIESLDLTEATCNYWELRARLAEYDPSGGHKTPEYHRQLFVAQNSQKFSYKALLFEHFRKSA